jgi:hypothetical protein
MPAPEIGRQSAHVLLDAASVFDPELPDVEAAALTDRALQRLDEIGAVTVSLDEDDIATVDASNLVGASLWIISPLLDWVAENHGMSRAEVVVKMREIVDGTAPA